MGLSPQFDIAPRVYLLSSWRRALYMILGAFLLGLALFMGAATLAAGNSAMTSVGALFFIGAGIYTMAYGLRSRISISGSRITVQGAFRARSADRSEIEGQRTYSDRNGTYTKLILREGRGSVTFQRGFETDGDFDSWMRQIPDLDQRDREAILDKIAHDEVLGATPGERNSALRYAVAWAVLLHVLAIVGGVALLFGDESLKSGAAVLVIICPLLSVGFIWRSPLLYAVFKPKKDPRSELGFVWVIAGMVLLISSMDIHMVSIENVLALAALVVVVIAAALFNSVSSGASLWGRIFALLVPVGLYGYGLVVIVDTLPDRVNPAYFTTIVEAKHISHGKHTSYILDLAPWGPVQKENHITVTYNEYENASIGDPVCFNLRPGALHLAWYKRTPCTGDSSSGP